MTVTLPRQHSLGNLPTYLVKRKLEWAQLEKEKQDKLSEIQVPPGMKLLSEEERIENLALLKEHHQDLISQLSKLSLTSDSNSMKLKRFQLNQELEQTEENLQVFEKSIVFIQLD